MSPDRIYVIVKRWLRGSGSKPTTAYMVRRIEPDMAEAYGWGPLLGHFVAEEWSLADAMEAAAAHARPRALPGPRSVPKDVPAVKLRRFYRWISDGTALDALVVVRERGHVFVRVVAMHRQGDEYEPCVRAEIDVSSLPQDGEEPPDPNLEECCGCMAEPGSAHGDGCDHAKCPDCGQQLIACGEHDSDRAALWHGVDQAAAVARQLGWWTDAAGIDHLVEDYTRVQVAEVAHQITWNPDMQKYVIGDIDEAKLDELLAGSR